MRAPSESGGNDELEQRDSNLDKDIMLSKFSPLFKLMFYRQIQLLRLGVYVVPTESLHLMRSCVLTFHDLVMLTKLGLILRAMNLTLIKMIVSLLPLEIRCSIRIYEISLPLKKRKERLTLNSTFS